MKPRSATGALSLLCALAACSGSPAQPAATPAQPATSIVATPQGGPPEREAPSVVRCGVDDRPRPVGASPGAAPAPDAEPLRRPARPDGLDQADDVDQLRPLAHSRRVVRDDRALLGEPIAMPDVPPRPVHKVTITAGPPRATTAAGNAVEGGAGALTEGMTGAADPVVCQELAAEGDTGPVELEVRLASTAEPLSVHVERAAPTPFVRCLMERACQIRAAPGAASARISLPLDVLVGAPEGTAAGAPPSPPPPPPTALVEVTLPPARAGVAAQVREQLRNVMLAQASQCLRGAEPATTRPLRFRLTLQPRSVSLLDHQPAGQRSQALGFGPRLGAKMMVMEERDVVQFSDVRSEGPIPPPLRGFVDCFTERMGQQTVGSFPPGTVKKTVEHASLVIKRTGP
jgi:hypothetical protein